MEFLASISLLLLYVTLGCSSPIEDNDVPYVEPEVLDDLYAKGQYEEFCRLLRIDDVNLVIPREGNETKDLMFNEGIPYGDMLYTKQQEEESRQGLNFRRFTRSRWPNNRIPYVIGNYQFYAQQIRDIQSAIGHFNSLNTRVTFVPRRNEGDFVMFFSGNGCWSYVGRIGGQQGLSLQRNGCVHRGVILHEMIHAVGFGHEQARPDRDNFVRILWNNIPPQWHSQYNKDNANDIVLIERYDYYSIMHYGMKAPGTNKDAFQILQRGINRDYVGQNRGLTWSDVSKIRKLYN